MGSTDFCRKKEGCKGDNRVEGLSYISEFSRVSTGTEFLCSIEVLLAVLDHLFMKTLQ